MVRPPWRIALGFLFAVGVILAGLGALRATPAPLALARRLKAQHRIILATVPRSGNGWMRGVLETITRRATHSVFPEGSASARSRADNYTLAQATPCGYLNDCSIVRPVAVGDGFIVKTHFPFTSGLSLKVPILGLLAMIPASGDTLSNMAPLDEAHGGLFWHVSDKNWSTVVEPGITAAVERGESDVAGEAAYYLLAVRNPLDNFDAWIRYTAAKKDATKWAWPYRTIREFVTAWARHHRFWLGRPGPKTIYRSAMCFFSTQNELLIRSIEQCPLVEVREGDFFGGG